MTPAHPNGLTSVAAVATNIIGDIAVTAKFGAQYFQSTPLAITAVNPETPQQWSKADIEQIAGRTPNLTPRARAGPWRTSLVTSTRGVDGSIDSNPDVGIDGDDAHSADELAEMLSHPYAGGAPTDAPAGEAR